MVFVPIHRFILLTSDLAGELEELKTFVQQQAQAQASLQLQLKEAIQQNAQATLQLKEAVLLEVKLLKQSQSAADKRFYEFLSPVVARWFP